MKRILALMLCVVMLMSVTACKKNKDNGTYTPTTTTGEPQERAYALDPVINRFFVEFIEKYTEDVMDVQSIRRAPGTDSTKPEDLIKEYIATINGLTVTVRNASYKTDDNQDVYLLRVAIQGGSTVKSRDNMLQVFAMVARTVDPGCTTEMTDRAVDDLAKRTDTVSAAEVYKVSNYVNVLHYTPINEQYGVPTRIEIQALNYAPLAEK